MSERETFEEILRDIGTLMYSLDNNIVLIKNELFDLIENSFYAGKWNYYSKPDKFIKALNQGINRGIKKPSTKKKKNPYRKTRLHKKLASKEEFDRRSFRYKRVGNKLVLVGCPKGKWDEKRKKCKVGTKAQKILEYK